MRVVDAQINVLRNGVQFAELRPIGSPTVRMTDGSGIPTAFSGDFEYNPDIDWLADRLQPVLEIDGVKTTLGIYLPATVTFSEDNTAESVHVEAYDQCWIVRDTKAETMPYFASGSNYIDVVQGLLVACGISQILVTPTSDTLGYARQDWQLGTSYLNIVNQLLGEINYKPLWFNGEGVAILEPQSTPDPTKIQHTLNKDDIQSLLLPSISRESDIYSAPNVFICALSNVNETPVTVTVENNNPQSPLSIMRRGRRVVQFTRVDDIANSTALEAYARRQMFESMTTGEIIDVSTAIFPGYGVGDIVALHWDDLTALCIERGWTIQLGAGGTMTHHLERVVYNLDF